MKILIYRQDGTVQYHESDYIHIDDNGYDGRYALVRFPEDAELESLRRIVKVEVLL